MKPGWTQPTLSQDEIRRNGGVSPPPQPIMPTEFTIQLYEPDQQVVVRQKPASWGGTPSYEFSMPQNTFRTPSASALDRGQSDPVADVTVPRLNFVWKREGKITKDLACYLTGKSTDPAAKQKHRDPDIAVALFAALKEMTIYESNLYRVEMEDPKGLEVVLLLGAVVIKDLFLTPNKDVFNVGEAKRKNSGSTTSRNNSSPPQTSDRPVPAVTGLSLPPQNTHTQGPRPVAQAAAVNGLYQQGTQPRNDRQRQAVPPLQTGSPQPPPADPRTQWEIDAETARLKAAERERMRVEEVRRRERQRADEAEARRLQKMLDAEEKEKRRRQAEVDKETERLRRKYGYQNSLVPQNPPQPHRHSAPLAQGPFPRPYGPQQPQLSRPPQQSQSFGPPHPLQPSRPPQQQYSGPYLQPPGPYPSASASVNFGSNGLPVPSQGQKLAAPKKSFWSLRSQSDGGGAKLTKKKSSMW